jgi:hypothetical protein
LYKFPFTWQKYEQIHIIRGGRVLNKNGTRYLNIKGAVLENEQLKNYMEKLAANHDLASVSNLSTYPIPRLKDNFKFIEKTYNLLNEHMKIDIEIYPARRVVIR